MIVKIKKLHKDAVIPTYAKYGDAGMDLTAISVDMDDSGNVVYKFGLSVEIPDGYVGLIFPRSSISKYELFQTNSVGVVDSGYRGELMVKMKSTIDGKTHKTIYTVGDRVAQLMIMPYPHITFVETGELAESERGEGGYGSTN